VALGSGAAFGTGLRLGNGMTVESRMGRWRDGAPVRGRGCCDGAAAATPIASADTATTSSNAIRRTVKL
jgi:hypothetical protein